MKKMQIVSYWTRMQTALRFPVAAGIVVVLVLILAGCTKAEPTPPVSDALPATAEPTLEPALPTETENPLPTETDPPSFSIYGTWVPDRDTTTVLVNQPPAGQFCMPSASMWMPEIIIETTSDPAVARLYGMHEHLEYRDLPLDIQQMRIVDNFYMPEINQTLVLILQLEPDGRLYHEEQNLIAETVYCSASVYYVSAGD